MTDRETLTVPSRHAAHKALEWLEVESPLFHGWDQDQVVNWQAGFNLLRWLSGEIPVGGRTLETGCGYSTVLFAALAGEHVVVSPNPEEHKRVAAWCDEHAIPHDHVRFIPEPSDVYLPRASAQGELGRLDAALIDGDHAFPIPALDWLYIAPALREGGLLVVDDASIRACGEVVDFLRADTDRWEYVTTTIDDAVVFRTRVEQAVVREMWRVQPWNHRTPSLDERIRMVAAKLRLRTRLKKMLRR